MAYFVSSQLDGEAVPVVQWTGDNFEGLASHIEAHGGGLSLERRYQSTQNGYRYDVAVVQGSTDVVVLGLLDGLINHFGTLMAIPASVIIGREVANKAYMPIDTKAY